MKVRGRPLVWCLLLGAGCASGLGALLRAAPPVPVPDDNPQTPQKIALGRQLFHEPLLSRNRDLSCASCHKAADALADHQAISPGTDGRLGLRNAPSLINVAYRHHLFWTGSSPSLELQALGPISDHDELDLSPEELVTRLKASPGYVRQFQTVFGGPPSLSTLVKAVAAYERTLVSFGSPYDRFEAGDRAALSASAQRGLDLFYGKAECFHCHTGTLFTDGHAHNDGSELFNRDIGVAQLTGQDADVGKFITPSLRNVALTAPYMHDGHIKTLREVVELYNGGGEPNPNTDVVIRPLGLSDQELNDVLAFLNSLTDPDATRLDSLPPADPSAP